MGTALLNTLLPTLVKNLGADFFKGKMETFLICHAILTKENDNVFEEDARAFLEETTLRAINRTIDATGLTLAEAELLFSELPYILPLPYQAAGDILKNSAKLIEGVLNLYRNNVYGYSWIFWKRFFQLNDKLQMLKALQKK